jgi:mannose-6-phosphate isomerase-like protein (cupin superfamily)
MPELIREPSRVAAVGEPPKLIDEYVGRTSTGQAGLSIAHMRSPSGWAEPGQRPEFDEFTVVLRGALVVESADGQMTVQVGQGVHARPGEWVRCSTPGPDGAEYISVCVPAFTPATVHRDD